MIKWCWLGLAVAVLAAAAWMFRMEPVGDLFVRNRWTGGVYVLSGQRVFDNKPSPEFDNTKNNKVYVFKLSNGETVDVKEGELLEFKDEAKRAGLTYKRVD